jgi:hypothetical protein
MPITIYVKAIFVSLIKIYFYWYNGWQERGYNRKKQSSIVLLNQFNRAFGDNDEEGLE